MRLIRAELLKARRRQATWVLIIVILVLIGVAYLVAAPVFGELEIIEFPNAYSLIGQFAFGLGGLLALIYAAAFVGADWSWGVVRNVVARGESRSAYLLAKAGALAILFGIALLLVFGFGIVMTYVSAALAGIPVASFLRGDGLADLLKWLGLTYVVLIQRAAIGMVVAVIMKSQLAGTIVGVLLYLGEPIVRFIFTAFSLPRAVFDGFGDGGFQQVGPEWFQYLPITVGDYVINAAPGALSLQGSLEGLFLRPVPLEQGLLSVGIYFVITMAIGLFFINRQEIA